ncbi:PREDICTED: homeobox protein BEL1 homolog [Tarenaya hassleriana]|uniref:homeobox protein BEL1 homolog n=1 Tax=Tarenaya hassleriana TaxID=28532 RepID=UPI00053C7999|nr:PREDICTED: homeobox protein BEL1 homolog [Tarenaya hassleriana]
MARDFSASGEILSTANPTTNINTHHRLHHQSEMIHHIHGFDDMNPSNHHHHPHHNHDQIFSLNTKTGLIDFSKRQQHHQHQRISVTSGVEETSGGENLLLEDSTSSMRCCNVVNLPCEVNEERLTTTTTTRTRPSQGLSLSLSSSNPTSISLHSFELRPHTARQGYFGKTHNNLQHTQMVMNNNSHHHHHQDQFQILRSKYLIPAHEILNEFCSLGTKESDEAIITMVMKQKNQKVKQQLKQWEGNDNKDNHDASASASSRKHVPPLHSLEFMELQKRKAKLLSMLDEIDRRYRHYRDQMRAAVAAFEAAAGIGAAETYTALAAKAMSRHFRCLRDCVVGQIEAMGERQDPVAPGTTRGETPRLRLLDQAFRQQKVYRQLSLVEAHPWRPQRGLPENAVSILRAWLFEHFLNPYPSDVDKHILARQTGLSRSQVSNWFINARVRLWKPMIEEMYSEETRGERNGNIINRQENVMLTDPKPEPNPMIRVDPESLSYMITNPNTKISQSHRQGATPFGSTFDFSSYGHQAVTYAGDSSNQGLEEGTRGVSLTLGLQRHNGNSGVSLAFSPAASLFYGDCQQGSVQYSTAMLDGDESQNLPYRNLIGAQLLHDIV